MADHVVRRMTLPAHLFAVIVHQIARHSFGPAVPKKNWDLTLFGGIRADAHPGGRD